MSLKSRLDNPVFGPLFNALLRFTNDIIIDNGVVFLLTVCLISEEEFVDYLKTSEPHYVDFNEVSLAFLVSDLFTHLVQTEYASYVDDQRILPNDPMQEIAAQIGWEPQPLNPLYSEEAMKFVQSNKELHKFFVERIRLNFNLPKKKVIDFMTQWTPEALNPEHYKVK